MESICKLFILRYLRCPNGRGLFEFINSCRSKIMSIMMTTFIVICQLPIRYRILMCSEFSMCVMERFISVFVVVDCVRFIAWGFYNGAHILLHRKTKLSRRGVRTCGRVFLKTFVIFYFYNQLIT